MELIDVELTEFTRRSRSVLLAHRVAGIDRGLEHGERVLLNTGDEVRTAVVADIGFDLEDTHYRLILGGRVPSGLVQGKVEGTVPATSGQVSVHDVADMLTRSGAGHRIPMQRQSAQRLHFEG